MKRFYLKNTVMDWHPKNVMYIFYLHFFEDNAYFVQVDSFVPRDKNYE